MYSGKNIFLLGADVNSYFGPAYSGNVEAWYIDFKNFLMQEHFSGVREEGAGTDLAAATSYSSLRIP